MNELPKAEGGDYRIFPEMDDQYRARRFEVGELLYQSIGVPRTDKPARYRQYARNFQFIGAPVGLLQTVMLLARGHGLNTCPQQAVVSWHKTMREFLGLPDGLMVYSGMALGFADEQAAINGWRSPRAPLDDVATFTGFDG